jgi:hypothetical protein
VSTTRELVDALLRADPSGSREVWLWLEVGASSSVVPPQAQGGSGGAGDLGVVAPLAPGGLHVATDVASAETVALDSQGDVVVRGESSAPPPPAPPAPAEVCDLE